MRAESPTSTRSARTTAPLPPPAAAAALTSESPPSTSSPPSSTSPSSHRSAHHTRTPTSTRSATAATRTRSRSTRHPATNKETSSTRSSSNGVIPRQSDEAVNYLAKTVNMSRSQLLQILAFHVAVGMGEITACAERRLTTSIDHAKTPQHPSPFGAPSLQSLLDKEFVPSDKVKEHARLVSESNERQKKAIESVARNTIVSAMLMEERAQQPPPLAPDERVAAAAASKSANAKKLQE